MKTLIKTIYIFFILSSLVLQGCGKKENKNTSSSPIPPNSTPALSVDPQKTGMIKGKVLFKGEAPTPQELPIRGNPECSVFHPGKVYAQELLVQNGRIENVFIYVKEGLENYSFETPKTSIKMDQSKCLYVPHVLGVQVNQPVLLVNSDPTLHNVHSYSKNNPSWNLGMPFEGMEITKTFSSPEVMISLKCDVHPWMTGYLGVVSHPYFVVTEAEGTFELKNLPPGKYVIEAWHEKLGTQDQSIEITPDEEKELEFTFELLDKK
ncbi:MAG: hypothetical protein HYS07_02640 [Chlamydiae bacterium]|nr:hypothetical protein [Chlamydiota bacterium]MBI3277605.1 hypothetical protein [Chlamydiota bacterium]